MPLDAVTWEPVPACRLMTLDMQPYDARTVLRLDPPMVPHSRRRLTPEELALAAGLGPLGQPPAPVQQGPDPAPPPPGAYLDWRPDRRRLMC